jgi:hypothetical protein
MTTNGSIRIIPARPYNPDPLKVKQDAHTKKMAHL